MKAEKFVSEKAIVSELGVNDPNPVPEKSGDVITDMAVNSLC